MAQKCRFPQASSSLSVSARRTLLQCSTTSLPSPSVPAPAKHMGKFLFVLLCATFRVIHVSFFAKTGSGQTEKPHRGLNRRGRCVPQTTLGSRGLLWRSGSPCPTSGKKTGLCGPHLYTKMISLPRQARDKHRKLGNAQEKDYPFSCESVASCLPPAAPLPLSSASHAHTLESSRCRSRS